MMFEKLSEDMDSPAVNDSFVLQRLQGRLQELEAENEELQTHCENCNDLLSSMQNNLELTSASAEEAEGRCRELELQLELSMPTPKAATIVSVVQGSAGLSGGVRLAVLVLMLACEIGVGHRALQSRPGATEGQALGSEPWPPGAQALWVVPTLAGLLWGYASGRQAAIRAGSVPFLIRHAATCVAVWIFGVDLPTLRRCESSSHAGLHLFMCGVVLYMFHIAIDQPLEDGVMQVAGKKELFGRERSTSGSLSKAAPPLDGQLHHSPRERSAGPSPDSSPGVGRAHFEVLRGRAAAGQLGAASIWDSEGSSPESRAARQRAERESGGEASRGSGRESSGSDYIPPREARGPTRRQRPRPEPFSIDESS